MRNLLFIGMLLVAASMAGWFQISREGDRTTIEIDRSEIRDDARRAIDRGREFLDGRDEQYADQQQPLYDEQGRPYWPQEQIASQQEPWESIQQQSYNQDVYQYDRSWQPQQPYYPPANR